MRYAVNFCLIIAVMSMVACGNQEDAQEVQNTTTANEVKEEARETVDTLGQFADDKKAEYQQSLEARLEAINDKRQELEARVQGAGKDIKAEAGTKLAELKSKQEAIKVKLDDLGTSSGEAWNEMRSGMEGAVKEVEEGYEQALTRFSGSED